MAEFLSDEWIDALDRAVADDAALREATAEVTLTIQQVSGAVAYVVRIDRGATTVRSGRAEAPDVTFTTDRDTALALHLGRLSAQAAFMDGRLQVTGDLDALVRHGPALAAVGDPFATVRHGCGTEGG